MKNELDLVREFSELNEAKIDGWGTLPAADDKRHRELKRFFDDLVVECACGHGIQRPARAAPS